MIGKVLAKTKGLHEGRKGGKKEKGKKHLFLRRKS